MFRVKNVKVFDRSKSILKNFNKQFSKESNLPQQADVVIIGNYILY